MGGGPVANVGWLVGGGAEEKGGWDGGKDCCGWDTGRAGA